MKLLIQKGGIFDAPTVKVDGIGWTVVFDNDDQPIAAIETVGDGVVMVTTCSDKQFVDILKRLGVGKAPVVREVAP
jgi:hypothetical protein